MSKNEDHSCSMSAQLASDSEHDSDWETMSEGANSDISATNDLELTLEQPVQKDDVDLLQEIPVSELAKSKNMVWAKSILTYSNSDKGYERSIVSKNQIIIILIFKLILINIYFQIQYFVMMVLAQFVPMESDGFELCHGQVSLSSTPDLRRRLAIFCGDINIWETCMVPVGHTVKNCRVFWSLVGTL